jgi:hypothetical protein
MATNYPSALDTTTQLPNANADGTTMATTHPAQHNNTSDAIRAVEGELGLTPKGSFTSVAARLNARLTCRKTADTTNATTTLANVTDMTLPVATTALDYYFEFWVPWSSGTAGVMAQFAVTVPAVTGYVVYWSEALGGSTVVPTTAGAAVTVDQMHSASASAQTATGGSAAAPPTLNVVQVTRIQGILSNPSATGSIVLQVKAETTGTVTVKRGSYGELYIN